MGKIEEEKNQTTREKTAAATDDSETVDSRPRLVGGDDKRDIMLVCNPRAGGRWRELARILDSDEAQHARRIVTDSIDDIAPALSDLSERTQLVCVYGGDGTVNRVLDHMSERGVASVPQLAFIGGGTMNVTARWCGLRKSPAQNFRDVVQAYLSGNLLTREVPLLRVEQDGAVRHGFTFGSGPVVRVLDAYERGPKGSAAAVAAAVRAIASGVGRLPSEFRPLLKEIEAEIWVDDQRLPYSRFAAVFCNVTGSINLGVTPFVKTRTRDTFYYLAYAVGHRDLALSLPFLVRGRLPIDPKTLLKPVSSWKQIALSYLGRETFPVDPRYINDVARSFEIHTAERLYTVDGEIVRGSGSGIKVGLGESVKLAVSSTVDLTPTIRLAADVTRNPRRKSRAN